jgi:hypothetical protein
MPIQFIDGSGDPEFETWKGDLLMAAALSVIPKNATFHEEDISPILADKFPALLFMWSLAPEFRAREEGMHDAAAE